MTEPSVAHGTFVVERHYPATPARIFRAWADPQIKQRWFGDGSASQVFEFREGGREYSEGTVGTDLFTFDVLYQDIVENQRIVYTYQMTMGGKRLSVSVAAVELLSVEGGTRMTVTEHGCFLDGLDTVEQRRQGTEQLMDMLGAELERQQAN
jgi:uncharacterized protein YndB with AHSA1/START domain